MNTYAIVEQFHQEDGFVVREAVLTIAPSIKSAAAWVNDLQWRTRFVFAEDDNPASGAKWTYRIIGATPRLVPCRKDKISQHALDYLQEVNQ